MYYIIDKSIIIYKYIVNSKYERVYIWNRYI